MASSPAIIIISADLGLVPLQLQILGDFMGGAPEHRRINLRALEAIDEIRKMADKAREDLGLERGGRIQLSIDIETRAAATPLLIKLADQVAEALENTSHFWSYWGAKADGAEPTPEDYAAAHSVSLSSRVALDTYLEHRRMMQTEH